MRTYAYSAIADGSTLAFDPASDLLWFDSPGLSAANLQLDVLSAGVQFNAAGKSFTLSGAVLSALDGSNVLFADGSMLVNSSAANLYADNLAGGAGNDLLIGGAAARPIELASATAAGVLGNSASEFGRLSADGHYLAFLSFASNLVPGDTNDSEDVFLRDNVTGQITRVSTGSSGQSGNASAFDASLSNDASHVAFGSNASNLTAGDTNQTADIFVKDLASGAITRVSTSSSGGESNGPSVEAVLSGDSHRVAFRSDASNLVANDNNGTADVFVKNLATGELVRASTTALGAEGNDQSYNPSLDREGRHVAFESFANNLVGGDNNGFSDIFSKDLDSGAIRRVSTAADGSEANGTSGGASISAEGRWVAFYSNASNLVAGDLNGAFDVFVKNLLTGTVQRASCDASGHEGNGDSFDESISADGRWVAFRSNASNLVAGDTNQASDIFVKDLNTGAISRLSSSAAGAQADNVSYDPSISADGSRVAFDGIADNLVAGDNGTTRDVFLTDNPLERSVLRGGAGDDAYLISRAQDRVVEAANGGIDTVRSSISVTLAANVERLELLGNAPLAGHGNASDNTLLGNAGDNLLDGAAGIDTASYASAAGSVVVDLAGSGAQDTGGAGIDTLLNFENLSGSAFDDTLFGNAGSNALDGGGGADTLIGGAGNDSYAVDRSGDRLVESANGGIDSVRSAVSWVLGTNFENLQLLGSANLRATGNGGNNVLGGNRGSNVIDGGAGNDTLTYLSAASGVSVGLDKSGPQSTLGAGADTLVSIENLTGSRHDDTLHGNAGNNVLDGSSGIDTLSYARAAAAVTVSLGLSGAQATGGAGTDRVSNFENLTGSRFADHLGGSAGANLIDGGAGNDTMAGGAGNDTYIVNSTLDVVVEAAGGGTDTVISSVSRTLGAAQDNLTLSGASNLNATGNGLANVLAGNAGANLLNGGGGSDTASYAGAAARVTVNLATGLATGGSGSDTLLSIENVFGSAYADALAGNGVANVLAGGTGADTLTGGAGTDTFVFSSLDAADRVTDFVSGADHLRIGQSGIRVGDGDARVEGAVAVAGPGFAASAELVVVTTDVVGSITKASAAALIGQADSDYTIGRSALFVFDNGSGSAAFLFKSLDNDRFISADELTLLATLSGTAHTAVGDYTFSA